MSIFDIGIVLKSGGMLNFLNFVMFLEILLKSIVNSIICEIIDFKKYENYNVFFELILM